MKKSTLSTTIFWVTPFFLFVIFFAFLKYLPTTFGLQLKTNPWFSIGFAPLIFLALQIRRRRARDFVALVLLCLLIGLPLFSMWAKGWSDGGTVVGGFLPMSDAAAYFASAEQIPQGIELNSWASRRPIFHAFLASLYFVSGKNSLAMLALLAILCILALFISMEEIRRKFGGAAAGLFVIIFYLFIRRFIGVTLSEHLGLILGVLSLAAFIQGIYAHKKQLIWAGGFLLSLGLNARAGCFFVLIMVVLWAAFIFDKKAKPKTKAVTAFVLAGCILLGFVGNSALLYSVGDPKEGAAFSNYAYCFYGLVFGGNWTSALDNPAYKGLSEKEATTRIFADSIRAVKHDPKLLMKGVFRAWKEIISGYAFVFTELPFLIKILGWFSLLTLALILFDRSRSARFILACAIGMMASVPFVPPWDADGMRAYATTIPYLAIIPAFGLLKLRVFAERWFARGKAKISPLPYPVGATEIGWRSPLMVFSGIIVLFCLPAPVLLQKTAAALNKPFLAKRGIIEETPETITFRLSSEPRNFLRLVSNDGPTPVPPSVRLDDFRSFTACRMMAMYPEWGEALAGLEVNHSLVFDPFLYRWLVIKTDIIKKGAVYTARKKDVKYFNIVVVDSGPDIPADPKIKMP